MSLSDRLNAPPRRPTGLPCSVGSLRAELPTDEQVALDRMLYDLGWSATRIHAEVTEDGKTIGLQSINRHRAGVCRCSTDKR